ncbi:response regulator [Desulfonauticus submarinus]
MSYYREKVLIIDDETSVLKLFDLYLKIYGYESLLASNGEQGLKLFKEHYPKIVFTDIKMPGIDGIMVLKEIKRIKPETEVIVVTGHGDMDLAIKALNLDATDFLNKPIGKEEIEKALYRAQERLRLTASRKDQFEYVIDEKKAKIRINGPVNGQTYPFLQNIWEEVSRCDVRDVEFIFAKSVSVNGAGISFFKDVYQQAKQKNIKIRFSNLSSHLEQIFENIGVY